MSKKAAMRLEAAAVSEAAPTNTKKVSTFAVGVVSDHFVTQTYSVS